MDNAVYAAYTGGGGFAALSGGSTRYETGSHVDMSGFSLMAGLARRSALPAGNLTWGAFFEFGSGSYDTYNSFPNAADVHGGGDTEYIGGGLLARMDFSHAGGYYAEASARGGRISNEYGSDLLDGMGRGAGYESSSPYFGLHLGVGRVWNVTDTSTLDLYAKYFWTHVGGDSVTLSTGDPVTFEDADSHRLRVGARYAYAANEYFSPYIGLAYEHEFAGEARASTYGYSIGAPSLEGGTGIGELGFSFKPSKDQDLFIDLGVQGYTGVREGVTGSLQIRYEF
jgi:outer membrane autotransporter protein